MTSKQKSKNKTPSWTIPSLFCALCLFLKPHGCRDGVSISICTDYAHNNSRELIGRRWTSSLWSELSRDGRRTRWATMTKHSQTITRWWTGAMERGPWEETGPWGAPEWKDGGSHGDRAGRCHFSAVVYGLMSSGMPEPRPQSWVITCFGLNVCENYILALLIIILCFTPGICSLRN